MKQWIIIVAFVICSGLHCYSSEGIGSKDEISSSTHSPAQTEETHKTDADTNFDSMETCGNETKSGLAPNGFMSRF